MNVDLWRRIAKEVCTGIGVERTLVKGLATKSFLDGERRIQAIQQNPETDSVWAKAAREGRCVVQFKDATTNKYLGVVVDGRVTTYSRHGL